MRVLSCFADYVPCLPNVKSLRLRVSAETDDSLRVLTNLARACPILETCTIEVLTRINMSSVSSNVSQYFKINVL